MQSLSSVKVPNASMLAAMRIREAILQGQLAAGQRLKEEQLSRELEISRTPVREALLILQAEGLVVLESKRGATVRSYSVEELDDMYQMRALLEGAAARQAAMRVTDEDLEILEASCERFRKLCASESAETHEFVDENMLFHSRIVEVTGSRRLNDAVREMIQLPLVYKAYIWYSPQQKRLSEHYHSELVRVLGAHDSERAEMIMKEHVYEGRDHLIATIKAHETDGAVEQQP